MLTNKNQVQYCYWQMKRKENGLNGSVEVQFVIDWNGKVTAARIPKSRWTGDAILGREVETCIVKCVNDWRFECVIVKYDKNCCIYSISENNGTATVSATYLFE